jgi:hypothetical protein
MVEALMTGWTGNDMGESCHGLIEALSRTFLEDLGKTTINLSQGTSLITVNRTIVTPTKSVGSLVFQCAENVKANSGCLRTRAEETLGPNREEVTEG